MLCVHQNPESNEAWKKRIEGITTDKIYRNFDGINGEPTEFEWNIFSGCTTLQLCGEVNDLLNDLGETPETFTGRIPFMSMFNDISCDRKGKKMNAWQMPESSPHLQRSLVLDSGHSLVQVQKRSGILWKRSVHKEFGIISRTKCCWNSQKTGVQFSVQRLHCPGVISKAKDKKKLSIHFTADYPTIETIFRIIVFANQLSLHGAVANMCEEFESLQDQSGQPDVLMGQSNVLSEIKAEVPLDSDIPSHQNLLLQRYEERIK